MSRFVRGGGCYKPLVDAGEHICECLRDGDKVSAKFNGAVRERIVRCRDCDGFLRDATLRDEYPHFCAVHGIDLRDGDGFCAWPRPKEA